MSLSRWRSPCSSWLATAVPVQSRTPMGKRSLTWCTLIGPDELETASSNWWAGRDLKSAYGQLAVHPKDHCCSLLSSRHTQREEGSDGAICIAGVALWHFGRCSWARPCVSRLGLSIASDKLSDMGSAFVALGAVVDLAGAPEKVEVDLVTELESVLRENSLKRHEVPSGTK
eukprot:2071361-Amphidinium_carterae.1